MCYIVATTEDVWTLCDGSGWKSVPLGPHQYVYDEAQRKVLPLSRSLPTVHEQSWAGSGTPLCIMVDKGKEGPKPCAQFGIYGKGRFCGYHWGLMRKCPDCGEVYYKSHFCPMEAA